jgi:hypothetical protein
MMNTIASHNRWKEDFSPEQMTVDGSENVHKRKEKFIAFINAFSDTGLLYDQLFPKTIN